MSASEPTSPRAVLAADNAHVETKDADDEQISAHLNVELESDVYLPSKDSRFSSKQKKPKSGPSRSYRRKPKTNSTTPSVYRSTKPSAHVRAEVEDIVQYKAVDVRAHDVMYRKTAAPALVPYSKESCAAAAASNNPQTSAPEKAKRLFGRKQKKRLHLHVALPELHPRLHLSNRWFVSQQAGAELTAQHGITHVINVSDKEVGTTLTQKYFAVDDDRKLPYHAFMPVCVAAARATHECLEADEANGVVVHCQAGINRSVSVLIAYAILYRERTVRDTLEYVERTKKEAQHRFWASLTNGAFHRYLMQLYSDHFKASIDSAYFDRHKNNPSAVQFGGQKKKNGKKKGKQKKFQAKKK